MQPPIPDSQQQYGQPVYNPPGPSPQSGGPLTSDERNWAMACHLAGFAGYIVPGGIGHILGPLIVWLMKKDTSAFVNDQGMEAVNFNISVSILTWVCIALFCTIILIPLAIVALGVLAVFDVVCRIMAALAASSGQTYRYPLTFRFLKP